MNTTIGSASEFNSAGKSKLADLVRLSMGTASIVQFAQTCDLSVSFLSKALNMALTTRPSQKTLAKLAGASQAKGTTLKDFYNACGYDSATIDEIATNEEKNMRVSFAEAERAYFASPAVMAVSQLLSVWMKSGNSSDVNINLYEEGKVFIISDRTSEFKAIFIACYSQDVAGMNVMRSEIMARTFAALGVADKTGIPESAYFYLLTDSEEMFDFCSKDLPKLSSQNMVVLLSDEQHTCFCKQGLRLSEGQEAAQIPVLVTKVDAEDAEQGSDSKN